MSVPFVIFSCSISCLIITIFVSTLTFSMICLHFSGLRDKGLSITMCANSFFSKIFHPFFCCITYHYKPKNCCTTERIVFFYMFFEINHKKKKQMILYHLLLYFYFLNIPFNTNPTFAGRSARRRIKYPYQSVPYGTYTRILYPSSTSFNCNSFRMPYSI